MRLHEEPSGSIVSGLHRLGGLSTNDRNRAVHTQALDAHRLSGIGQDQLLNLLVGVIAESRHGDVEKLLPLALGSGLRLGNSSRICRIPGSFRMWFQLSPENKEDECNPSRKPIPPQPTLKHSDSLDLWRDPKRLLRRRLHLGLWCPFLARPAG